MPAGQQGFWGKLGGTSGIGGDIGNIFNNLFGDYTNPYDESSKYLNQIPGQLHEQFDPFINHGKWAGNALQDQFGNLLNDPGGMLNKMGANYQQSPGFKFALQQALQGANHAAAAGGMGGSPASQQQNMQVATGLANQDYNNWIRNAMGLYGQGLQGSEGMYGTGANMAGRLGEDIAGNTAQQAYNAQQAAQEANNRSAGLWGSVGDIGAGILGAFSSAALKDRIDTPSTAEILDNVRHLSLDRWKYKDIGQSFLGTYAEEFAERFGVGDGKTINLIDMLGVLMGAVKELDRKISDLENKDASTVS